MEPKLLSTFDSRESKKIWNQIDARKQISGLKRETNIHSIYKSSKTPIDIGSAPLNSTHNSLIAVRTHVAALGSVVGELSALVRRMLRVNAILVNVVAKILETVIVSWLKRLHVRRTVHAIVTAVSRCIGSFAAITGVLGMDLSASIENLAAHVCSAFVALGGLAGIARVTAPRGFVCDLHAFNMWTVTFSARFEHGGAQLGVAFVQLRTGFGSRSKFSTSSRRTIQA